MVLTLLVLSGRLLWDYLRALSYLLSYCLSGPIFHCNHLVGEEGPGCYVFLWLVACVLSVMICFFFLLVSLMGNVLWLWLLEGIQLKKLHAINWGCDQYLYVIIIGYYICTEIYFVGMNCFRVTDELANRFCQNNEFSQNKYPNKSNNLSIIYLCVYFSTTGASVSENMHNYACNVLLCTPPLKDVLCSKM